MSISHEPRPGDDGGVALRPHVTFGGTIRNGAAELLAIDIVGTLFAGGDQLDGETVPVNEGGQTLYYRLEAGEQTGFSAEADVETEPDRFELTIETLKGNRAEDPELADWGVAEENGCVQS